MKIDFVCVCWCEKLRTRKQCLYNSCFNFPFRKSLFYMQTQITRCPEKRVMEVENFGYGKQTTGWNTMFNSCIIQIVKLQFYYCSCLPPVLHVLSIMHPILYSEKLCSIQCYYPITQLCSTCVSFFKSSQPVSSKRAI